MGFLNSQRVRVYPRIFLALYIVIGVYWLLPGSMNGPPWVDRLGKPFGTDFVGVWTASQLALSPNTDLLYQPERFYAAEQEVSKVFFPLPWQYPPTFLVMVLPLSLMPYLLSLVTFLAITLAGYLMILRFIAPHPSTFWLALAFPATFQNVMQGQNGFLTTGLLGGGLLLVDSHPVAAGVCLGFLTYKPHLVVLIPAALICGRHWKALVAMLSTTMSLVLTSITIFGSGLWLGFFKNISFAMSLLTTRDLPLIKMPTVFAGVLLVGGSAVLATIAQLLAALMAAVLVSWVWYRREPIFIRASVLSIAVFMVTPHAFDYDLTILALPLAWFTWEVHRTNCLTRSEEIVILLAWLAPFIIAPIARLTFIQVGPILLALLLVTVFGRRKAMETSVRRFEDRNSTKP